jgi:hypothetical protein
MKFKLTCEYCRRQIEYKATVEQSQELLQRLQFVFPCPRCVTPIQVRMMADGLSFSTMMPGAEPARQATEQPEMSKKSDKPSPLPNFPLVAPDDHPFHVPNPESGSAVHVPFQQIRGDAPRKFRGSAIQRFFHWYNNLPLAAQWVVLSPLLLLLVLLLMWDPSGESATKASSTTSAEKAAEPPGNLATPDTAPDNVSKSTDTTDSADDVSQSGKQRHEPENRKSDLKASDDKTPETAAPPR